MKIIFFTLALLAATNAHFLRHLEVTLGEATYSTSCTNFVGLNVTATLTGVTEASADIEIVLSTTVESKTIEVTVDCSDIANGATTLICAGNITTPDDLATTANGKTFKLTKFNSTTITTQQSSVTYNKDYLPLGTNADQEIDYNDDTKKNFTVTYKNNFAEGATLPEIKVGTEVANCSLTTTKTILTCVTDKSKVSTSEDAYQITAKNACGTYDNVAKLTVKDSAVFLKASLALLVAVFLF